jgi:carboxypeptidase Taq
VEPALAELKRRLAEIKDLARIEELLQWDMEVWMPEAGLPTRASQLTTLAAALHDRRADERLGELVDELAGYDDSLPHDDDDACLVRIARRDWEKASRVPSALAAEIKGTAADAHRAWVKAREDSDFDAFRPWLERMLELRLEWAECFAPYDDPYDVFLDHWEPGMLTTEVRAIFDPLESQLVELADEHETTEDDAFLRGPFPVDRQEALSREIVESFGGTWNVFRLDRAVHPFATSFGRDDIRLTSRYYETDLNSLFTAMHECGHGLVEHGVSATLEGTPLCEGASNAIHESQSRLWENVVGRSLPFWRWFYPRVREAFPDVLGNVPVETFHAAVNRVRRGFIRVDADQTTYGLHVILRFDLEQDLVSGRLAVADLPTAWNGRFAELFGREVPNDRVGVLQDVHWAGGSFGYFPTYLLGTVLSVQVWNKLRDAVPDVDERMERGDFAGAHEWLRENLYLSGRKFMPRETIERVVGGPIDPDPYLRYLRERLAAPAAA